MILRKMGIMAGVAAVRFYQMTLGVWLGGQCRFYPSCSNYAIEAIREHGLLMGLWYSGRRIGRCHPFNPGGVDLVPPRKCGQHCAHAWRP